MKTQPCVWRIVGATLAAIVLSGFVDGASASVNGKPNILFFFVDDMGWQDTSVPFHTEFTALNQRYRTPNMERLAAQGMKFTQAYACVWDIPGLEKYQWKLVYQHVTRNLELYNLRDDIGEKKNLATDRPEKLSELARVLTEFLKEAGALLPTDKRTGKRIEYPIEHAGDDLTEKEQ